MISDYANNPQILPDETEPKQTWLERDSRTFPRNVLIDVVHLNRFMSTFLLVPGAWLGGWAWKKVAPLLEEADQKVYAATLTGEGERVHLFSKDIGIETAIEDVLNIIKYNDIEDFVLVGHSFAGKVVAAVADRVPERVRMILYLDAERPEKGVREAQSGGRPPFEPKNGEWGIPLTDDILNEIGKDVKGNDLEWLLSKATPWPYRHKVEPVTLSKNFDSIKSSYIFCTGGGDPVDEILHGKWGKLDGPYKVIESGHWPMITKPEELVEDMLTLSTK